MKKNITINLYGELYNIDEDAYEALNKYIKSIARYFSREDDGAEVADDIERRVAELLWAHKQQGHKTVDIETVRHIIQQIGNPEQIAGIETERNTFDEAKGEETPAGRWCKKTVNYVNTHRFYRSSTDCIWAGVCGGIAYYFNINDPLWVRLAFVLLTLFTQGPFLIVYLILWLLTPKAVTPEDRLKMKGKDVNPQTLADEILNDTQDCASQPAPAKRASGGCATMAGGCLLSILVIMALPLLIFLTTMLFVSKEVFAPFFLFPDMIACYPDYHNPTVYMWGIIIGTFLLFSIPICALIRIIRPSVKPMSVTAKVIITILWLIAAIYCIVTLYNIVESGQWVPFCGGLKMPHL